MYALLQGEEITTFFKVIHTIKLVLAVAALAWEAVLIDFCTENW
jgi:hypothetical protein